MKPWNNGTIGKLKPVMKKLLIALLVILAAYAIGAAVFAVANGQAEGKVLIAEKQLLADGDMEAADTSSWSASGATLSKESGAAVDGSNVLRVTYVGASGYAVQTPLTIGKTYRLTGWYRTDGTANARINLGGVITGNLSGTDWTRVDLIETALQTYVRLHKYSTAGNYVEFDDIVITEYTGKTTISDSQLLADGDMEEADASSWVAGNNAILTKESGSFVEGKRILRVTYNGTNNPMAIQVILTTGKTYKVSGKVRSDGSATPRIRISAKALWNGDTSTDWQSFNFVFTNTGSDQLWFQTVTDVAGYTEWDDLFITEYAGKTITGGKQLLADGDMEKSGTDDWIQYLGRGTATKVPGGRTDGKQALRITADSSTFGDFYQTILTGGKTYRVTGWARGDGVRKPILAKTASPVYIFTGTASTEWQRVDVVFTANGATDTKLRFYIDGGEDHWAEFDDMIVVEL